MKPKLLIGIDQSNQSETAASGQKEDGCNYPTIVLEYNLLGVLFALFEWKSSISFFNSSFNFIFPIAKANKDYLCRSHGNRSC